MTNSDEESFKEILQHLKKPIVLVGMMGAGKTSIGRKLAHILDLDFFDSDLLIEEKAALSIAEIFETFGEEKFRQSEKNTVLELLDRGVCVIATGGGAIANAETLDAIQQKSVSIWLKNDAQSLYERVKSNPSRPLLQKENPKDILENLIKQRTPLYAQADIHIDQDGKSSQEIIERLIHELSQHLKKAND